MTGGERSIVNGTIDALSYPGANVFLINPVGVIFGPTARLNVGGSFHVSTADVVRSGDGGVFPANPSTPVALTAAPPSSFGFLTPHPAPIAILGSTLQVPAGQSLSVVGGDIFIRPFVFAPIVVPAALRAPSGRVSLISVASTGEVGFNSATRSPELSAANFGALGNIRITQGGVVDASGDPGGSVMIRGGRLVVDQLVGIEQLLDLAAREKEHGPSCRSWPALR